MTVFTEGFYTGEYILSEANGKRGRGKGTVAIGNELVAGAIVELTGGEYVPATNGGTDPVAISYAPVNATEAAVEGAVFSVRDTVVKKDNIGYPEGFDDAMETALDERLAAQGIKVVV